jgi:hypothetical protein
LKLNYLLPFFLVAACSTAKPPAQPAPWTGDTLLAPVLNAPVLGRAEQAKIDTIAGQLGEFYEDRLIAVIEDTLAPVHIRTKAIYLLGQRPMKLIDTFVDAFGDRDERVRAAAVGALQPFMPKSSARARSRGAHCAIPRRSFK